MKQIATISLIIFTLVILSSVAALPGQKHNKQKTPSSVVGAGSALSFNGSQYDSVGYSSSLDISTALTLEAWINPSVASNNGIIEKTVQGLVNSQYLLFIENGAGEVRLKNSGGATTLWTDNLIPINTWTHIAATWDGDTVKMFINGVQQTHTATVAPPLNVGSGWTLIGLLGGGVYPFSGIIDEVRVWNVARTQQQIRENMHLRLNGNETGLQGYWRFDEGSGSTAYDATSNANDGTLMNGPAWVSSTAPFGMGTSASLFSFTDGTDTLGSLILSTVSPFPNPLDITVTQITAPPDSLPVGSSTILGDRYWVIDTFTVSGPALQSTTKLLLHPGKKTILHVDPCLNLTFTVPQSFTNNGAANPSSYTLYSRGNNSDGAWSTELSGASGLTATDVTFYCTTAYEQLALGTDDALPIQLATLSASVVNGNGVKLNWTTVSETNNYGFYVERRPKTGTTFTTVSDLIPGAGTSLQVHHYSWTDMNVGPTSYVYRLRQVDMNGHASYSNEIVVAGVTGVTAESAPKVFQLVQNYPNPFNPTTEIKFSVEKQEHATVKVYNILGVEVAQLFNGMAEPGRSYRLTYDGTNVGSGIYFYRIQTDSRTAVRKMVLMK